MFAENKALLEFHVKTKKCVIDVLSNQTDLDKMRAEIIKSLRTGIDECAKLTNDFANKDNLVSYYFDFYFETVGTDLKHKEIDSIKTYLTKLEIDRAQVNFFVDQFKNSIINLEEVINSLVEYRSSEIISGKNQYIQNEYYVDTITELLISALGVIKSSGQLFELTNNVTKTTGAFCIVANSNFEGWSNSGILDLHCCDIWSAK